MTTTLTQATHVVSVHPDFNQPDADLTIQSADGVQFKMKRHYLSATTGAFPGAEFEVQDELTYLTEPSKILAILFQFTTPKKHPDLQDVDFETILAVAEAAEKYEIFAAMNICQVRIRKFIPTRYPEILAHAVKHDYPDIVNEVVPRFARADLVETIKKLPPPWAAPWCRYYKSWDNVFNKVLKKIFDISATRGYECQGNSSNEICAECRISLVKWVLAVKMVDSIDRLRELCRNARIGYSNIRIPGDGGFQSLCGQCRNAKACKLTATVAAWLEDEMDQIPAFDTLL